MNPDTTYLHSWIERTPNGFRGMGHVTRTNSDGVVVQDETFSTSEVILWSPPEPFWRRFFIKIKRRVKDALGIGWTEWDTQSIFDSVADSRCPRCRGIWPIWKQRNWQDGRSRFDCRCCGNKWITNR